MWIPVHLIDRDGLGAAVSMDAKCMVYRCLPQDRVVDIALRAVGKELVSIRRM
jgi:hypothetical protein